MAHLSICERHIAECRAKARKAQIYQSFIDHPAPKMAEMGEMAVARLQATQHVASTNDFQADTLAVHSALMARLPPLSHYAPQHMHVPGGAEDAAAAQASAVLSQMPATTVVVRLHANFSYRLLSCPGIDTAPLRSSRCLHSFLCGCGCWQGICPCSTTMRS